MKIEKQVISLKEAKRLAELLGDDAPGSLWVWSQIDGYGTWGVVLRDAYNKNPFMHIACECLPAYTGEELWALLPICLNMFDGNKYVYLSAKHTYDGAAFCGYYNDDTSICNYNHEIGGVLKSKTLKLSLSAKTEVCAKAALSILLLEQKLITPKEFSYEN